MATISDVRDLMKTQLDPRRKLDALNAMLRDDTKKPEKKAEEPKSEDAPKKSILRSRKKTS